MSERFLDHEGSVHAGGVFGDDAVLCGDVMEGENGDTPMTPTTALIDCKRCTAIILGAKRVRSREIRG